ncbi:hypothetical protein PVAP13_9NG532000 [Panicum virgatum]|uniref:Dof zinc finger protein n=1 Tax=Panicum virgatum TaxID=38727 RepID=A0A8T0MRJ0_PANVG|nr:hypothetical protein PVAP13_9NG532000 [Panicum virgatum]
MLDATRRRKQTTKEDQFSAMLHHGRIIPTHGGGTGGRGGKEAHRNKQHHHQLPGAPPVAPQPGMPAEASMSAGGGSSSCSWVKPGCMMELARLAKIPPPESGLPCPRCRSADTKFCYYNNYSLSQPRHFCRACRHYWTHGGALRDLPFSSSARRRRRSKPASTKHEPSSKVASCCASGTGARASPSTSSGVSAVPGGGGGRAVAAVATAVMHTPQPLAQLASLAVGAERHRTVASSRLWLPGHRSSQQQDPLGYQVEHQWRYPPPQRQPLSFLGYINAAIAAPPTTPAAGSLIGASDAGGTEAGSFAGGQMQAAIISRVPGSAALTTEPAASEMMMGTLTTASSPGEFQVESGGLSHFLGSGSWACSYGSCSAGNGGGSNSCAAAPGTSVWPDPSGPTSSSSGTML